MQRTTLAWATAAVALGVMVTACSSGGSDTADSRQSTGSTLVETSDETSTEPVENPACDRLSAGAVSFAAGEEFTADVDAATQRTCSFRRTSVTGDSINLSISASDLDPQVQLDALASSPAGSATFRAVDLGEGAFFAEIDGKPRVGVFVDGELIELVLVASTPLGADSPADEVLLTLLSEAAGLT